MLVGAETLWHCTDGISERGRDRGHSRNYDADTVAESVADTVAAAAIKAMP